MSQLSNAVDRHLRELVADGTSQRLVQGLYYVPRKSVFGVLPSDDQALVAGFLRDKRFHNIAIASIEAVERDTAFDDQKMRSAGIHLL